MDNYLHPALLALSRWMLAHGVPDRPESDADGLLPLTAAVLGDYAVTVILGRYPAGIVGPGPAGSTAGTQWCRHTVLLRRLDGRWERKGGGREGPVTADLADRPPAADLGAGLLRAGGGSTLVSSGLTPWSGRYLGHVLVRASREITQVLVAGRNCRVPPHGQVVVAWMARQRIARAGPGFGVTAGPAPEPRIVGAGPGGVRVELPPDRMPGRRRFRRFGRGGGHLAE